jgi:hypothetical protein
VHQDLSQHTDNFVRRHIDTLVSALRVQFGIRVVQQSEAQHYQVEQEKALSHLLDVHGGAAPMKQQEIEQRIIEFKRIDDNSTDSMQRMAMRQRDLWSSSREILTESTWCLVSSAYKDLHKQAGGTAQEVRLVVFHERRQIG